MNPLWYAAGGWLSFISLVSIIVTCHDKRAAKKHRRRVPERTLLWLSALGGAVAMYATMRIIRHKTQKAKFMVGIPAIFLLEVAVGFAIRYFTK